MIPVFRPRLPTCDKAVPYLREIDQRRWYTNQGPLLIEFEKRLAAQFGIEDRRVATAANATLALMQTLVALDVRPGTFCVMPCWTFAATPAAAVWAGMKPYFADVEAATWQLSPAHVKAIAQTHEVGAVIVVAPFGAPVDVTIWDDFVKDTGIPVLVDAAASFDAFSGCGAQVGSVPVIISFHATKVSGIGEGAMIIAGDTHVTDKLKMLGNFGFRGSRNALLPGINSKLSEYAAAMGLAFLDEWPQTRNEWVALSKAFADEVNATPHLRLGPNYNRGWVSSYGQVELPPWIAADEMMVELRQMNVESRQWWSKGCHRHTAYRNCARSSLVETERLIGSVLGLPFWLGLSHEEIATVFDKVRQILRLAQPSVRRPEASSWAL